MISKLKGKISMDVAAELETVEELEAMESFSGNDSISTNAMLRREYIKLQDQHLQKNVTSRTDKERLEQFFLRRCARDTASWTRSEAERKKAVLYYMDQHGALDDGNGNEEDMQGCHDANLKAEKECLSGANGIGEPSNDGHSRPNKKKRKKGKKKDDVFENLCFKSMKKVGTREMGHFIKIDIFMDEKGNFYLAKCFCERFRHTGVCFHATLYEIAHEVYPLQEMIIVGEEWDEISENIKKKLCDFNYLEDTALTRRRLVDPLYKGPTTGSATVSHSEEVMGTAEV
jgi:hypothetical protein